MEKRFEIVCFIRQPCHVYLIVNRPSLFCVYRQKAVEATQECRLCASPLRYVWMRGLKPNFWQAASPEATFVKPKRSVDMKLLSISSSCIHHQDKLFVACVYPRGPPL